jgi:K+-transporting ATPase KdpF subunit
LTWPYWLSVSACWRCRSPLHTPAIGCEETPMIFEYALAGIVTLVLLIYLTYALLRPERF